LGRKIPSDGGLMRALRSYRRVAQEIHFCDRCHHDILPGDEYEGHVCVEPNYSFGGHGNWLIVWKYHLRCPVDPDEEERWQLEQDRRVEERERQESASLMAA
jgi:hypothetical protein